MTLREQRALREVQAWRRRSLAQRRIRQAQIREGAGFSLVHRGAYRLPDVGAHPIELPPAVATVEYFGSWGKQVKHA